MCTVKVSTVKVSTPNAHSHPTLTDAASPNLTSAGFRTTSWYTLRAAFQEKGHARDKILQQLFAFRNASNDLLLASWSRYQHIDEQDRERLILDTVVQILDQIWNLAATVAKLYHPVLLCIWWRDGYSQVISVSNPPTDNKCSILVDFSPCHLGAYVSLLVAALMYLQIVTFLYMIPTRALLPITMGRQPISR